MRRPRSSRLQILFVVRDYNGRNWRVCNRDVYRYWGIRAAGCAARRVDYHNMSCALDIHGCIPPTVRCSPSLGALVRGLGTTMRGHGRWDSPSLGVHVWGLSTMMRGYGNWGSVSDFQKGNVGRRSGLVHTTRVMTRSPRGGRRGL